MLFDDKAIRFRFLIKVIHQFFKLKKNDQVPLLLHFNSKAIKWNRTKQECKEVILPKPGPAWEQSPGHPINKQLDEKDLAYDVEPSGDVSTEQRVQHKEPGPEQERKQ